MAQKQEEYLDYEQHLSDRLQYLYFDDPDYAELRKIIQSDKEPIFAVRKDEIHIYYLGGRILKITKSNNRLKFSFDFKYAKVKKGSDEFNEYGDVIKNLNDKDNRYDVKLWIRHFDVLKKCMKNYREKVSHNEERQLQQRIELANRDFNGEVIVIDNEYGVREIRNRSSKLCKVDLVTLYRDGEKYKICLVELKLGDGAIDKKAGISDHIADFNVIINARKRDIITSVNRLIEYKKLNHSLYNVPNDIKLSDNTEICATILCYDLEDIGKALSEIESSNKKGINFALHSNLYLKSACPTLTKRDHLGE